MTNGVPVAEDQRVRASGTAAASGAARVRTEEPPDIAIADWDGDGYQAPIVLAVVQATVTGEFLTVADVVPVEGELEVASDLTFGRVQRRTSGPRLLRATGSTARGDDVL